MTGTGRNGSSGFLTPTGPAPGPPPPSGVVHDLRDVQDMFLEDSERVRIRQHEGERLRTGGGRERLQVDPTIFRRNLDQVESEHPGRGGVRAVCRVGNDDFVPLLPALPVVRLREE